MQDDNDDCGCWDTALFFSFGLFPQVSTAKCLGSALLFDKASLEVGGGTAF